jgi:membrane fusion protein
MTAETPLFRKEVLEHRADRLHGDISLAVPMAWHVIGLTMLAALVIAFVFLATASYARIETVKGEIALDRGIAPVIPTRRGSVTAVAVRDGARVRAGDPLVRIHSEEDMASGDTASTRADAALAEQDARLASQSGLAMEAAVEGEQRLVAQLDGIRRDIVNLDGQIQSQRRLIEVAAGEFQEMQTVAARGYISRRDLNQREAALIQRRQELARLDQARSGKVAEGAQVQRGIAQARAQARSQEAAILSTRAALAGHRAEDERSDDYVLAAPVDGTVTAVTARPGQPASPQQPLMVVMPANARPQAELYVPTQAAGFLAPGQEVRLAIDAFPYQSFGTVRARILRISAAPIPRTLSEGNIVPVYLITAELAEPYVTAFGRRQPLLPGMTLSARIVTDRQSLLRWLFEPLFAVSRR